MSKKTITVLLAALMTLSVGTASFAAEDFLTDNEIPIVSGVQVESGASEESIKEETAIFPKATENTEKGSESDTNKAGRHKTEANDKTEVNNEVESAETDADIVSDNKTDVNTESEPDIETETEVKTETVGKTDTDKKNTDDNSDADKSQKSDKKSNTEKYEENSKGIFDEIKAFTSEVKKEISKGLKEMKAAFSEIAKEKREEFFKKIAEIKAALEDSRIDTYINGSCVDYEQYDNVYPVIDNDRTLVPARAVSETMGATVKWDEESGKVSISKDDVVIEMVIGEAKAFVNGEETALDTPCKAENGRTIVPVRFIAESFGLNVEWNEASKSIVIE